MKNLKYLVSAAVLTISPFVFAAGAQAADSITMAPSSALASQNVISGSMGVELGRFMVDTSTSTSALRITQIKVVEHITKVRGDTLQSLQLKQGSKILTTGANVVNPTINGGILTFNLDQPLDIPAGQSWGVTAPISLFGNISTTATSGGTYRFDFIGGYASWTVTSIATGLPAKQNQVWEEGATMTVSNHGSYAVTVDALAPTEKWYAAGSTGVTVNVLRFTGVGEPLALTNLRLQMGPMGSSTAADLKAIELWDGSTLVARKAYPAFSGGTEDFQFPTSGNGSFIIPKDQFKRMTIKVDLADIGAGQPGTAGQMVSINYSGIDSYNQRAVGLESNSIITTSSVGINNLGVVYFRSRPTISGAEWQTVAQPYSGTNALQQFRITADSAYDVAIHKLVFEIATSGITQFAKAPANFTLYNLTDGGKRVGAPTGTTTAYFNQTGNYSIQGDLLVRMYADTTDYATPWVTIPAGASHTFELRANLTTDGTADAVMARLIGDSVRPNVIKLTGVGKKLMSNARAIDGVKQTAGIIWTDFSADATSTTSLNSSDWMNGYKVPGLIGGNVVFKDDTTPPIAQKPDLAIKSATFAPNPPVVGATTNELRVVVVNGGNASAGSFNVVFVRGETILKTTTVNALAAGATNELRFVLPQLYPGKNDFFVRVDYNNTVQESNENNNQILVSTGSMNVLPTMKIRTITTSPHRLRANSPTWLRVTFEKTNRDNRARIAYETQISIIDKSSGLVDFENKGSGIVVGFRDPLRFSERWTPTHNGVYQYRVDVREVASNATSSFTGEWVVPTPAGSTTSTGVLGGVLIVAGGLVGAYALARMRIEVKVKA